MHHGGCPFPLLNSQYSPVDARKGAGSEVVQGGCHLPHPQARFPAFIPTEHLPHPRSTHLFFLLQIFTETLGQTVQTVMYALILLFLLMVVFAILGHGWCRDPKTRDTEDWGSLKAALFTIFSLVTVSTAAFSSLSQPNDKLQILECC